MYLDVIVVIMGVLEKEWIKKLNDEKIILFVYEVSKVNNNYGRYIFWFILC